MKKNIHYISIAAAFVAVAAMIIGCKPNVSAAQDTTAPAEVTELKAVAGNGKISLSWVNPADADLYQVEISASPAAGTLANSVYLFAEKGKTMSFTAEGLTNGTAYTFTVKTIDKSLNKSTGVSTAEAVKPIDTSDKTPPAEVTNLSAVPTGNSKISVSWTNPADADLYQVEIIVLKKGETAVSTVYISAEKGKDSGYIVEGLAANTTYTVTVKTIDSALNKTKNGVSKTVTTKAAGSAMSITLSQSPAKDTKTNGSVTVTVASSTSIKEAKWKKGAAETKAVLESGTAISGTSFTVSENGIYSVAVQDNDGRREVETIKIENIDKEPPAKVIGLAASYSSTTQKIMVNWQNPADSDFAGLTLSWKKGTGSETTEELTKDKTSYEIPNIATDGSTYTITVITKDAVGNKSEQVSAGIIASNQPTLGTISLEPLHLAYNASDLTITATLSGSNFNRITSHSDPTVKAGIFKDNALVGSLQNANPDGANYKVTLTAPHLSSYEATAEGAVYTVKVKLCGTYQSVTKDFIISQEARLTAQPELGVTQIAASEVTSTSTTKITIKGINLDIAGGITVQLYDSNGVAKGIAVPIDTSHTGRALTTLTADIPVSADEGVFTAKVLFGGEIQTSYYEGSSYNNKKEVTNPTIQVYGSPKFTSFKIPNAGISKEDGSVTAVVKGANFKAPGVTASNFSVSCAEKPQITNNSAVTIIDDATLNVTLTIPGTANDYTITVSSGSASTTATFAVKDYSAYTVGKIVLADKTVKSKDEYTAIDPSNPPVAIICGTNGYGAALGIALHTGSSLVWAEYGSTGYKTEFKSIICTPSQTGSGAAQTATFTGDTDGSDNWEYIKQQDPAGAADAATNYPAFHWVNTYNTTYAAKLGSARPSWYMPSLAELCEVYKNKDKINASLKTIHDILPDGSTYADEYLETSSYWSSSQNSGNDNRAWDVIFGDGNVVYDGKYNFDRVCCLSGF